MFFLLKTNEIEEWVGSSAAVTPANTFRLPNLKKCSPKPLGEHRATSVFVLELRDVVRCIGAGERYVYRRNPGWTQITFTNLKRPSSKLHKVKGWFSSKGFFQLFYFGKKLQVLPESIFYYWFSTLCFCTFACYSKIFFNLNLPDFFLIKTKAAEVIFWPQG